MPNRLFREGLLTSEPFNSLDIGAQLFFMRLLLKADNLGLYDARPRTLKNELYGYMDDVKEHHCVGWLDDCVRAGLLRPYEADGKPFIFVEKFGQKLRNMNPKYPLPDWIDREEEIVNGKLHVTYTCRSCVGHVSYTCRSRALHVSAEEKRSEEKRREENNNVVVASSTLYPESAAPAPAAAPPLATTTTTIFPEGFEEWVFNLKQAHQSLRYSHKLAPDVLQAALDAFDRFPDAASYAPLLTAYLASRLEKDKYGHTFYRPAGQALFFANLEDTLAHAERWSRETSWNKKTQKAARSAQEAPEHACSPPPEHVPTEEENARFVASLREITNFHHDGKE